MFSPIIITNTKFWLIRSLVHYSTVVESGKPQQLQEHQIKPLGGKNKQINKQTNEQQASIEKFLGQTQILNHEVIHYITRSKIKP
jgi:hypothetical protein